MMIYYDLLLTAWGSLLLVWFPTLLTDITNNDLQINTSFYLLFYISILLHSIIYRLVLKKTEKF